MKSKKTHDKSRSNVGKYLKRYRIKTKVKAIPPSIMVSDELFEDLKLCGAIINGR